MKVDVDMEVDVDVDINSVVDEDRMKPDKCVRMKICVINIIDVN